MPHLPCSNTRHLLATMLLMATVTGTLANENRPYDQKLVRLSELLGSIHYLRELCGAEEGQAWRDRMQALLKSEGTSAARRAKFAKSFNQGYQNYSRTYKTCTPTATTAIRRFLTEGVEIAETLLKQTN